MRRFVVRSVLAALLVSSFSSPSARAQTTDTLGECAIEDSTVIDVVLLLDQSASLKTSDTGNQRVAGAQSVVRAYAAISPRVRGVRILIAGFGEDFSSTGWMQLNEDSKDEILQVTAEFASKNDSDHTDYVYGVGGALTQFQESAGATCRTLFWFTDGEHDLDADYLDGGLSRTYLQDDLLVTEDNYEEIESMMPGLICGPGKYADALGDLNVSTRVMLLGHGERMDAGSSRVLRGMGGDAAQECGPGVGTLQSVDRADELPYRMACLAQVGLMQVDLPSAVDGRIQAGTDVLTSSNVPPSLVSELRIIARGNPGSTPSFESSTDIGLDLFPDPASGTTEIVVRPAGQDFEAGVVDATEACGFVVMEAPLVELQQLTPALREGEAGEFSATIDGPYGKITAEEADNFELTSEAQVARSENGWILSIPELPPAGEYDLEAVVEGSGSGLSARATLTYSVNQPLNAPVLLRQPEPVVGEGGGPFRLPVQIEGHDGGEFCVTEPTETLPTSTGPMPITVSFDGGGVCIEVPPNGTFDHEIHLALEEPGFVEGSLQLETRSTPTELPDRFETGVLTIAVDVTPEANTTVVGLIVAGLILLLLLLIWAVLYGINRLVSRIPDPRRNGVRYAEFNARIVRQMEDGPVQAELVNPPGDADLKLPKRSPSELRAGPLTIRRRVPLAPWRVPYATISMRSHKLVLDTGRGLVRKAGVETGSARGRPTDALGPLTAVAIAEPQWDRLQDGGPLSLPGVILFDLSGRKGEVASRVVEGQLGESLERIQDELDDARTSGIVEGDDDE